MDLYSTCIFYMYTCIYMYILCAWLYMCNIHVARYSTCTSLMVYTVIKIIEHNFTPFISINTCTHVSLELGSKVTSASSDLLGQRASSSSKKMTQGAEFRARWNTNRTARSLSPTYWETHTDREVCTTKRCMCVLISPC